MRIRSIALAAALALAACATTLPPPAACSLSERDRAWRDRAIHAWHFASRELTGIGPVSGFEAIFFSADCTLRSSNALSGQKATVIWTATPHYGVITLPDGSAMPAGVVSYVSSEGDHTHLVMSTPTVWEAVW